MPAEERLWGYANVLERMIRTGVDWRAIERIIDEAALGQEQRSALWLWAVSHRDATRRV